MIVSLSLNGLPHAEEAQSADFLNSPVEGAFLGMMINQMQTF
jgi:hypothetical protein